MSLQLVGTPVSNLPVKGFDAPDGGVRLRPVDESLPDGAFFLPPPPSPGWLVLRFICPCGCRTVENVRVRRDSDPVPDATAGAVWSWDGNLEAPTLSPSIHRARTCGWHGFLRAGVWSTCD